MLSLQTGLQILKRILNFGTKKITVKSDLKSTLKAKAQGNFTVYRTVVSTLGITKYIRHQNIIKERETDHVIGH